MMLKTLSITGFYFWFACYKVICMNSSPVPSLIPCSIPNFLVLFYLYGIIYPRAKTFVNCTNHAVMFNLWRQMPNNGVRRRVDCNPIILLKGLVNN